MNLPPIVINILTYTLSGAGVVWVAYYLFKPYLDNIGRAQAIDYKKSVNNQTLPLKLQAYERLVLFIERINPASMMVRLNAPTFSAAELQNLILVEVRTEFQHNVTQQIYVSDRAWEIVKKVKDDTIAIVTTAARSLPEGSGGIDLAKTILGGLSGMDNNPYDIALALLKKDLENLF